MARQNSSLIDLRFPVGGLNRQSGFDQQPPYTTPFCRNVRPFDVVNLTDAQKHGMRHRGGARPGTVKAYATQLGAVGARKIQLLFSASVVGSDGIADNILLAVANGTLYENSTGTLTAVSGTLNATAPVLRATQVGSKVYIADYRPVEVRSPKTAPDGTIASTNRLSATSIADWTTLGIDTALDVVWISGSVDIESNIFPITSVTAGYIVFDGTMTNQSGEVTWQIGRIPKVFDPANPATGLTNLMDTLPIPQANYNVGTVTIVNGAVTMSGGSWAGVPQATDESMLTITVPVTEGVGTVQYLAKVNSLSTGAGTLTLNDTSSDTNRTNVTYTLNWMSDYYGLPPLNCRLCCNYRGRLVLAGPDSIWYMSRILNPNDWDYGYDPNDGSRPVAGTSTTAGGVPGPITTLIPHSDDYLIFGCERSLWLMTSDPAYGGSIHATSREIGVLGAGAWCALPDSSVVILSRDGLYVIPAGGQPFPVPLSRPMLPAELLNLDYQSNIISLAYDVEARGIHLSVTPTAGTTGTHYFIDWTTKSFWPMTFPDTMQATAMVQYSSGPTSQPDVLFGCLDGYVRKYSNTATTDDGTAFSSLVCYGPFRVGGPGYYGQIVQIASDLDLNGQGVSWGIFKGDHAQGAIEAAVNGGVATAATWYGTWVAGSNHRQYPGSVAPAFVVMVSGTYGWAIEGMRIEVAQKGPVR